MYSVKDEVHKVSALTESLLKAEQRIAELKLKIEHLEEESNKNKVGVIKLYFQIMVLDKWPCLQCFDAVGWAAGRASGL